LKRVTVVARFEELLKSSVQGRGKSGSSSAREQGTKAVQIQLVPVPSVPDGTRLGIFFPAKQAQDSAFVAERHSIDKGSLAHTQPTYTPKDSSIHVHSHKMIHDKAQRPFVAIAALPPARHFV